jgi:heme exporter protein D
MLNKHGFTENDIDQVAMEASVNTLASLENLALKHELRREAILGEIERRRERRGRQQPSAARRQIDGGGRALARECSDVSAPPQIGPSR